MSNNGHTCQSVQLRPCLADTNDRDIQEREVIVGIVTDIDLLHYIARQEGGGASGDAASGSSSPTRTKSNSEASN